MPLLKKQILTEQEHRNYQARYGDMYQAGTGGEAIRELLRGLDLAKLVDDLKRKMREDTGSKNLILLPVYKLRKLFLIVKIVRNG